MLRSIAGFEPVRDGRIRLDGAVIADARTQLAPERRRVGMVFQDYALFPHLDVALDIGFGLRGRPPAVAARVAELLATVGLEGHGTSSARALGRPAATYRARPCTRAGSGPAAARQALLEPGCRLRERLSGEVREIIKAAGTTAILVTHDQHEAFAVPTRSAS